MAKMAKAGISQAAMEETQLLIAKPLLEVQDGKNHGVEWPGQSNVNATIE
jgi:hypothetical protein